MPEISRRSPAFRDRHPPGRLAGVIQHSRLGEPLQDHSSQREVVYRAAEDTDPRARDRLIELLAIGVERWLARRRTDVDLSADLSVHADVVTEHRSW